MRNRIIISVFLIIILQCLTIIMTMDNITKPHFIISVKKENCIVGNKCGKQFYDGRNYMNNKREEIIKKAIEDREKRAEAEKEKENYVKQNQKNGQVSRGDSSQSIENIFLLAKLIQSEALDEPYEGKIAVGSVVVNRMKSSGKSLEGVIYAKNQFSGVNGNLFNSEPSIDSIKAAKETLNGYTNVGNAEYFVNRNISNPSWVNKFTFVKRIGNHWFYKNQ